MPHRYRRGASCSRDRYLGWVDGGGRSGCARVWTFHHSAVTVTGYNNSTGYFYGSLGLAVVFGGAGIIAAFIALFSRTKGVGLTAVGLLFLAAAAGITAEILH